MQTKKLVLLSGGLDSTVLAAHLQKQASTGILRALYINLGFPASTHELASAKSLCFKFSIPIEIVALKGILEMMTPFVPIDTLGDLDKGQPTPIPGGAGKDNYVSGFSIMLSVATHYCQIAQIPELNVAITKEQINYNPGLAVFLSKWASMLTGLNAWRPVTLKYPFGKLTKGKIIALAKTLGVDLKQTWSCYRGESTHCGECHGCLARKLGFQQLKIIDPTNYKLTEPAS